MAIHICEKMLHKLFFVTCGGKFLHQPPKQLLETFGMHQEPKKNSENHSLGYKIVALCIAASPKDVHATQKG